MPVVFIHGVNVREGPQYHRAAASRDAYLRAYLSEATGVAPGGILNPYWGQYGARFSWNLASVPTGAYETLGPELAIELLEQIAPNVRPDSGGNVLSTIAREYSLESAIDASWAHVELLDLENEPRLIAEAARAATEYAVEMPSPRWLVEIHSDDAFLQRLLRESSGATGGIETFGSSTVFSRLCAGVYALRQVPHDLSAATISSLRRRANADVARFAGDACTYFTTRGTAEAPGPIVDAVMGALQEAASADSSLGPLIVIAHSMGGNIAYDVLTGFAPDITCDVLVTVGSQVALFEEMKQFVSSDDALPNEIRQRVLKPANVKRWLNVFDRVDPLSYAAGRVFEGVEDVTFSASASPLYAHVRYFEFPRFFQLLAARLATG